MADENTHLKMNYQGKIYDDYLKSRGMEYPTTFSDHPHYIPIMNRLLGDTTNKNILELGAFNADSLKYLNIKGNYTCIEGSKIQVNRMRFAGINAIHANLEEPLNIPDNTYDIIFHNEVIEHIINTENFLKECNRILKPNGIMIFSTPNSIGLNTRIRVMLGYDIPTMTCKDHVRAWSINKLSKELQNAGFNNIKFHGTSVFLIPRKKFHQSKIEIWLGKIFPSLSDGLIIISQKQHPSGKRHQRQNQYHQVPMNN